MYTYYYMLYKLQIFYKGNLGNRKFSSKIDENKVWQEFLKERNVNKNVSSVEYYKLWEDLIDDPSSFAKNMKKEYHIDYN